MPTPLSGSQSFFQRRGVVDELCRDSGRLLELPTHAVRCTSSRAGELDCAVNSTHYELGYFAQQLEPLLNEYVTRALSSSIIATASKRSAGKQLRRDLVAAPRRLQHRRTVQRVEEL